MNACHFLCCTVCEILAAVWCMQGILLRRCLLPGCPADFPIHSANHAGLGEKPCGPLFMRLSKEGLWQPAYTLFTLPPWKRIFILKSPYRKRMPRVFYPDINHAAKPAGRLKAVFPGPG